MSNSDLILAIGGIALGGILLSELIPKKEAYGEVDTNNYPATRQFYSGSNKQPSLAKYQGPNANLPESQQNVNLNSGSQLLAYQIYQQAVNAATPTLQQLESISGQSQQQPISDENAPYNSLSDNASTLNGSEYQAVNMGSERAQGISACAQNAPTFVATSLLPKPSIPGEESWDIGAPNGILANQNFLSATQQIGVDTVLNSTRNQSYDIRGTIVNPINVVSPWNNTSITPDLERRPLECFVNPGKGLYGCNAPSVGANTNGTFVGQ